MVDMEEVVDHIHYYLQDTLEDREVVGVLEFAPMSDNSSRNNINKRYNLHSF